MDDKSFHVSVPKRWVRVAMIVGVTALIVAPLTAIASHSFTDVPDSNTFHDDIAWLADAGVTKGCNPPDNTEFCPDDNVTRGQMAAFMNRFAGYIGAEDGTPAQADSATTADDADTVDGLNAAALQTNSHIYRIPPQTDVSSFQLEFDGLPQGIYQVSFSVIARMSAAGAKINCHIDYTGAVGYELMGYGSTYSTYSTSNATGVIDTRSQAKHFRCFTEGGTATVDADYDDQSQVVLTPIDSLVSGNLTPLAESSAQSAGEGE